MMRVPMLPKLEKAIPKPLPKPLKKRYRDLFDDGNSTEKPVVVGLSSSASSNKITNLAASAQFASPISLKKANNRTTSNFPPSSSRATNFYRKSVMKRSITKHISIRPTDLEQIPPKYWSGGDDDDDDDNADADVSSTTSKFQIDYKSENGSHFLYLSNIDDNSSPVQFVGKLKVKWREKYENFGAMQVDQLELNEKRQTVLENFGYGKNVVVAAATTATAIPDVVARYKRNSNSDEQISASATRVVIAPVECAEGAPAVRKLERAGKGLIYQKFMATTYSWNKKKEQSVKNMNSTTQSRKRGRPKNVPDVEKRVINVEIGIDEENVDESTVALMRSPKKKSSSSSTYSLLECSLVKCKSGNKAPSIVAGKKKTNKKTKR